MSEKEFKLEIITPRKVIFSGPVISFSAPGVMGGFQVLYNHAPLLALIGIGEVKCTRPDGAEMRYATSGGFVDVCENTVVFLADTAESSAEIDVSRAEIARDRAKTGLAGSVSQEQTSESRSALERALNRIRTAQKG